MCWLIDTMRKHTDQYEVFVLFKNAPPGGCFSVSSDVQSGADETAILYIELCCPEFLKEFKS